MTDRTRKPGFRRPRNYYPGWWLHDAGMTVMFKSKGIPSHVLLGDKDPPGTKKESPMSDETVEKTREKATELEYLKWFYQHADFGPADGDVRFFMNEEFKRRTGKDLPEGYQEEEV